MMWSWLGRVVGLGITIVAMRWLLHAGHPRQDIGTMRRVVYRVEDHVRELARTVWRAYGPITQQMREAWVDLAMKYKRGDYGVEGT